VTPTAPLDAFLSAIPVAPLEAFPCAELVADLRFCTEEEFLRYRRDGVGSSDVAIVRGYSNYNTPLGLWQDKTGRVDIDVRSSEAALMGHLMEPLIAVEFAKRYGGTLYQVPYILRSKSHSWMQASCDFAILNEGGNVLTDLEPVEIKNRRYPWDDGVPRDIQDQLDWQLEVTGLTRGHVVMCLSGMEIPPQWSFNRCPMRMAELFTSCAEFWAYVQLDEPPPMMAEDTRKISHVDDSSVVLPEVLLDRVRQRQDLNEAKKNAVDEMEVISDEIRVFMGDAEVALDAPDGKPVCTYKMGSKSRSLLYKKAVGPKPTNPEEQNLELVREALAAEGIEV